MPRPSYKHFVALLILVTLSVMGALVHADIMVTNKISDVRGTKHNLSAVQDGTATPSGGKVPNRTVKASSETQVCVFCHTPHAATTGVNSNGVTQGVGPLWNRQLSTQATYTPYYSDSLDAYDKDHKPQPGGSSKLCLSCHDGTMAIDKVNVLNGVANVTIAMNGATSPVKMPAGNGANTGFTRNLGTDLSNDHPISFTFDQNVAGRDGELTAPDGAVVGNRVAGGARPKLPLEDGQMQCATCHDPHIRDKNEANNGNAKFLRLNRFQVDQHTEGTSFNSTNDIICLACHNKAGDAWAYSAHGNKSVANQTYTQAAATLREFPTALVNTTTTGPKVWQVACLNCHDTHTAAGARRLLREGVDSSGAALEQVCYSCHASSQQTSAVSGTVPDVGKDFAGGAHMPIKTSEQQTTSAEVHNIGGSFDDSTSVTTNNDTTGNACSNTAGAQTGKCGKDLLESRQNLGLGNLLNRHAECSDCHNPHRVVKFQDFRGDATNHSIKTTTPDSSGAHPHANNSTLNHTNIASGVLRGSWGVEPKWPATNTDSFHTMPSGFDVKKGDPGTSVDTSATATYVTREYQICLKCHSNYSYKDDNVYPTGVDGNRPRLGAPGTPAGTNGLNKYTNVAKEVHAPTAHQDEPLNLGTNAGSADTNFNNNNHRSWHPVMDKTGRTTAKRGMTDGNPWLAPWSNQVGSNTMFCSDCHGSNTTSETSVIPDTGNPWGPHGSSNNFILKGVWGASMGATGRDSGYTANFLCFKCHDKSNYTTRSNTGRKTGFYNSSRGNLHNYHIDKIQKLYCTWCHVAVPHGWKNKTLLVNLNDVGEEAGQGAGSSKEVSISGSSDYYSQEPYYLKAKLKVYSFAASGNWSDSNCGSRSKSGTGLTTGRINSTNGQTGNTTGTGIDWMKNTCSSPP